MNKLLRFVLDILTFGILEIVLYVRKRMASKTPQSGDFDQHPADAVEVENSSTIETIASVVKKSVQKRTKK